MPSLRVAFFVLPPTLVQRYQEHFNYYSSTVPRFEQHILAKFMKDGHFAKHLNRMRKIYRKKHDKCIEVFSNYYPQITISGDAAGTNILVAFLMKNQNGNFNNCTPAWHSYFTVIELLFNRAAITPKEHFY